MDGLDWAGKVSWMDGWMDQQEAFGWFVFPSLRYFITIRDALPCYVYPFLLLSCLLEFQHGVSWPIGQLITALEIRRSAE